ncbi:glycosyltransferase, partial [candidate division WOR-3 bacterium]|nr:glycosyltransferase [candidate division WOR-3 bacterium]
MVNRISIKYRLAMLVYVTCLAGLQMFIKINIWCLAGTILFFAIVVGMITLKKGKPGKSPPPDRRYFPFVSVIIAAHNEEKVIAETIKQAFALRYHKSGKRNYEVWVINDRSTDRTAEIVEGMKHRYPVNVLHRDSSELPGKAAALNHCLPLTAGEVLLTLDADALFPEDLISKAVAYLAPELVGGAQVVKRIINPDTNFLCARQADEYKISVGIQQGRDSIGGTVEFKGNGSFIKRSALESVGGWTNHTVTEDLDLSTKLLLAGYRIRFVAGTWVGEQAAPDYQSFVRQRLRWIEGSMLRYLTYFQDLLTSRMHPLLRSDMLFFAAE